MRFNVFRFVGGCIGGAVWFLIAAFVHERFWSNLLMTLGFAAILIGFKSAWVRDESSSDDSVE